MQTRRQAIVEVLTGTAIGLVGSYAITYTVFIYIDDKATAAAITVFGCTVWSLVRGYVIRRRFAAKGQQ